MKSLVLFDSNYGNTGSLANAIAAELGENSKVVSVREFSKNDLLGINLLVVGSPIIGWSPTEKMKDLLENLPKDSLKDIKVTSFDTRMNVFFHGDAAYKILQSLIELGGKEIIKPNAFFVKGRQGPLKSGELEKASEWGKEIYKIASSDL